jgi:hypothetical protein
MKISIRYYIYISLRLTINRTIFFDMVDILRNVIENISRLCALWYLQCTVCSSIFSSVANEN